MMAFLDLDDEMENNFFRAPFRTFSRDDNDDDDDNDEGF